MLAYQVKVAIISSKYKVLKFEIWNCETRKHESKIKDKKEPK